MQKVSIISIGDELLSGRIVDSNAAYLSSKLLSVGVETVCTYTVGDDVDMIVEMLGQASSHGDVVLITGGLGPTDDDITRHAMAAFIGVELEFYEDVYSQMQEFFARRDLTMAQTNRIQAYLPKGAKPLTNELGTAAGIMCQYEGTVFVFMPGVPTEMKQMFADSVFPMFGDGDMAIVSRRLHCFGTGESRIAEMVGDIMERGRNPRVNCTVSGGIVTLEVSARAERRQDAEKMAAADVEKLYAILADVVFGTDGETMAQALGKKLIAASKTIAVAESCTGGLLAKLLTDVAGASSYFTHGWVTYSNDAKVSELGIDRGIIDAYGAVSEQVAMAMATAARTRSGADIGVGITGIAGPGGGSEQKPVGLVYISVDIDGQRSGNRYVFGTLRPHVRLRAVLTSLNTVRLLL